MNDDKQNFERNLIKENNALTDRLSKVSVVSRSQLPEILDIRSSFEKLLRIIQGLPVDRDWLALETSLICNFCYTLLLVAQPRSCLRSTHGILDVTKDIRSPGVKTVATVDGVLRTFLLRVSQLGHSFLAKTGTINGGALARHIVDLLLAIWFPGKAKVVLLQLALLYNLWLLKCRSAKEAADMSAQLSQLVLPRFRDLFQIDSVDPQLLLPCVRPENVLPSNVTLLEDSTHLVSAISSFSLTDWSNCLMLLKKITNYPLRLYSCYAEGYVLYRQNSIDGAVGCLNELLKRNDLNKELSLMTRNLIGCCLSNQGKHRCAIQVFKKCLQDDIQFHLALYNIALQYRKLCMTDAELGVLRLLAELLVNDRRSENVGSVCAMLLFDPEAGLTSLTSQRPSRVELEKVVYTIARRCFHLQRFDEAVEAYVELFSVLSSNRSSSPVQNSSCVQGVQLPSLASLYSQAIQASILACKYDQTLAFCNTVLKKSGLPLEDADLDSQTQQDPRESASRPDHTSRTSSPPGASVKRESLPIRCKRLREEDDDDGDGSHEFGDVSGKINVDRDVDFRSFDIGSLLYKAEALLHVGQRDNALLSVNRAVDIIEAAWMEIKTDRKENQPRAKRIKADGNSDVIADEEPLVWPKMLSNAYSLKSLILVTFDRLREALHWSRLAYQLSMNDTERVYNLALLLYKLQHGTEAATLWTSHRDLLSASNDTFQLESLFRQRLSIVEKLSVVEKGTWSGRYCVLDVEALRILKTSRR